MAVNLESNYIESTWGSILTNPRFKDPSDIRGGKLFRRRFRVPYPMFGKVITKHVEV